MLLGFPARRDRALEKLILPGIFPYLVTGLVTASGGAWNASIVAEHFHFRGHIYTTIGLGAVISQATDSGNFDLLLAATILIAATVVTINRMLPTIQILPVTFPFLRPEDFIRF